PIAKMAAKLAVGYSLDEIPNDITKVTPASFDPSWAYVFVKIPRFTFEKFPAADPTLTTTMKSVGEVMALGRNFTTALQKAMRSLEQKDSSFGWDDLPDVADDEVRESVLEAISHATAARIHSVQRGLAARLSAAEVFDACEIDPWYPDPSRLGNEVAAHIRDAEELAAGVLRVAKNHGCSDEQIAALRKLETGVVTGIRHALRVRPVFKTVDTCAGEFEAHTPYHYSSYDSETEVEPRDRPAVIILGSGPNRIA